MRDKIIFLILTILFILCMFFTIKSILEDVDKQIKSSIPKFVMYGKILNKINNDLKIEN